MKRMAALATLSLLGGCSTCGSLAAASGGQASPGAPAPAPTPLLRDNALLTESPRIGDVTRIDVAGELFWLEKIALPEGASALVEVRDVSRQDTAAPVLASATYPAGPAGPIAFSLELDAERIPAQAQLAVSARVTAEGRLVLTSTTRIPLPPTGAKGLRVRLSPAG